MRSQIKVFVSSTWLDLQPEREAVEKALRRMRETEFAGMEYFGSRDDTTREASLKEVDGSHVYLGIFAGRYGSGITEAEYRRARERNLPCFIYFKAESTITLDKYEQKPRQQSKLKKLKAELRRTHTVDEFDSPADLAAKVTAALHGWLADERQPAPRAETPAPHFNALHQLPTPPADFTGRTDELAELLSKIDQGGVHISGLRGQGGIGKTALALKLAERLAPRYPDAQFYLDLRGADEQQPLSPAEALSHVLRAYHPTAKLPDDETQLRALYLSVLHGQSVLLLMDNARDAAQITPLIPPAGCVLLVTSRQHFTLPGLFAKDLDTLPAEDARDLLTTIAPRIAEHSDNIARLCDYLPLALRLAASALAERPDLTPADYLRRLSDERQRLKLLGGVEASINLSYALLTPDLQKLWRALAVFPDTFDAPAAAAVWAVEPDPAQDSLGELIKYSLLDWDDAACYSLHDLARLCADNRLSDEEKYGGQSRHAAYYLGVLTRADDLFRQGGEAITRGLALFDAEWKNIQAGQSWAARHAGDKDVIARLCSDYPNLGAYILHLRLPPRDRVGWLEQALSAARQSNDRNAEANHLGNLGIAYAALGETRRAVELHEQDLAIAREIGDRRGEGRVLGNLGLAYAALGETRRAIDFHEQDLAIAREIGDRRGEGSALGNLGVAYKNLGETRRAVELYEQDLAIAREIGDRHGEGSALWNMSLALDALGDRVQAIAHAEGTLKIFEQIEDPNASMVREWLAKWRGQAE